MAVLLMLTGVTVGCRSLPRARPSIRESLVAHRQEEINAFSRALLAGGEEIDPAWLRDERQVPIYMPLPGEGGSVMNYGVDRVSDYFLCLLEVREKTSTPEILTRMESSLARVCEPDRCDACFTATYPLDGSVRKTLVDYWTARKGGSRSRR